MRKVSSLVLLTLLCYAALPAFAQTPTPDDPTAEMSKPDGSTAVNLNPLYLVGTDDVTFLHFANAAPDAPSVDLYVQGLGDTPVAKDLAFGQVTDTVILPEGKYNVVAREAGSGVDGKVITTMNWNFQRDTSWLVTFIGVTAKVSLQLEPINLLRDDIADDVSRIRVVNYVTGTSALTVSSGAGDDFGKGLGWIGVFDTDMTPGSYNLTITSKDGTALLTDSPVDVGGGALTTVLLVGSGDGRQPIRLVTFSSPASVSRVQFVNNSGAAIQIFARPGKVELIPSLAAGETSAWLTMPSGSVTFVSYAPGTGPKGQELGAWIGTVQTLRDTTITFTTSNTADASDPVFTPTLDATTGKG